MAFNSFFYTFNFYLWQAILIYQVVVTRRGLSGPDPGSRLPVTLEGDVFYLFYYGGSANFYRRLILTFFQLCMLK
jgi:hypothetical protein